MLSMLRLVSQQHIKATTNPFFGGDMCLAVHGCHVNPLQHLLTRSVLGRSAQHCEHLPVLSLREVWVLAQVHICFDKRACVQCLLKMGNSIVQGEGLQGGLCRIQGGVLWEAPVVYHDGHFLWPNLVPASMDHPLYRDQRRVP
jgi:hypothetical protein